ncbi:MAG: hypothetical protein KC731_07665, partial [Myxococcales bacterium]|nr:hypothetical protein [Myxococcales bacterium]
MYRKEPEKVPPSARGARATRVIALMLAAVGCGSEIHVMEGSDSAAGGGALESVWPKRVVLKADSAGSTSDGLRLEDGSMVAGDGDLHLG